jgi:hypothetical protein
MKKESKGPGAERAAPAEKTEFSLIPSAALEAMYVNLLKGRMMEERRGPDKGRRDDGWAAVKAAAAAVLWDLGSDDVVSAADQMPLVRLLRGDSAAEILRGRKGTQKETARAHEAAQLLLHAVGAALANKTKKNGKVAVVFWRDTGLEYWRDALEMARAHTLPLIMLCPVDDGNDARKKADELPPGTELPRIAVDGYDAVAVYRVAHEAIERARRNRGATLIECANCCVAGKRGRRGDAVANMERYLRGKGMLRRGMKREIEERFERELGAKKKRASR